ncbi:unnamed protein product [Paramecium primaurelia]|uniref:Uncharacterized protein n=2 Tax=Paramecium TaxID=5884 RepID=A0A8S1LTN5_PARPR|nr:unnamed protein product [Paramecium primaurelia]CAD8070849.1 unnamed protein product [Paramecium primaurelia]CAD8170644.1 unnamed protein product [Paramecium pentaurelia]
MLRISKTLLSTLTKFNQFSYHTINDQIKLTDFCIQEIKRKQVTKFPNKFLRLGVDGAQGCSGFKYSFNFDDQILEEDYVLKIQNEIIFVVDEITLKFVNGCIIDYEDKMIRAAFYVQENPNAEKSCSCKASFAPKPELL